MEKARGYISNLVLHLMTLEVHPMVYLIVSLSVWHAALATWIGLTNAHVMNIIFMSSPFLNIAWGVTSVVVGVMLIIALMKKWWVVSSSLSVVMISVWSFLLAMLALNMIVGGFVMSLFYVLLFLYLVPATWMHHESDYPNKVNPRKIHYGTEGSE